MSPIELGPKGYADIDERAMGAARDAGNAARYDADRLSRDPSTRTKGSAAHQKIDACRCCGEHYLSSACVVKLRGDVDGRLCWMACEWCNDDIAAEALDENDGNANAIAESYMAILQARVEACDAVVCNDCSCLPDFCECEVAEHPTETEAEMYGQPAFASGSPR